MQDTNSKALREVVLDVETTGFDHDSGDRIIEIGAVELVDWFQGKEFSRLVSPNGIAISDTITNLTGLTKEDLHDEPSFDDPSVVDALLDFIGDADIVAHNASFDRSFLNAELRRAGREIIPESRWIDTMKIAREKFRAGRNSLDHLCERFKIYRPVNLTKHRAIQDCRRLAKVYQGLNNRLNPELGWQEKVKETAILPEGQVGTRGSPLNPLLTAGERSEHRKFVQETIGGHSVWKEYIDLSRDHIRG